MFRKSRPIIWVACIPDDATPSSNTPPEEESTDSSLMDDEGIPKPRKRRIHLPFGKKAKTPAWHRREPHRHDTAPARDEAWTTFFIEILVRNKKV